MGPEGVEPSSDGLEPSILNPLNYGPFQVERKDRF